MLGNLCPFMIPPISVCSAEHMSFIMSGHDTIDSGFHCIRIPFNCPVCKPPVFHLKVHVAVCHHHVFADGYRHFYYFHVYHIKQCPHLQWQFLLRNLLENLLFSFHTCFQFHLLVRCLLTITSTLLSGITSLTVASWTGFMIVHCELMDLAL